MEQDVELLPGETRETIVTTEPGKFPNMTEVTTTVVDTHVVAPGETLSEITYDKTGDGTYNAYMEVAEANNIENPNLIYPGDKIQYTVSEQTTIEKNNNSTPIEERPVQLENTSHTSSVQPTSYTPTNTGGTSGTGTPTGRVGGTLGIERATIGYDKIGLQAAVNTLNLIVFNGASVVVQNAKPLVHIAVDQCWAGAAADAFKVKFDRDADTMSKTLESLEEEVKSQFAQMAKNIDTFDQDIAESIDAMK